MRIFSVFNRKLTVVFYEHVLGFPLHSHMLLSGTNINVMKMYFKMSFVYFVYLLLVFAQ